MRTISLPIYSFKELSATAKDRARIDSQARGWLSSYEYLASLKSLAAHFGGSLASFEIDWSGAVCPSFARFDMPEDMERDEIRQRLDALGEFNPETLKGIGECKLTGFCSDEDAIDGFRIAFSKGENDLRRLMNAAFRSWLNAAHDDYRSGYEDANFAEFCDANRMEFYADGSLYRG